MAALDYCLSMELHWWSIEVLDGPARSARGWQDAQGGALTEAAITNGAYDWQWHTHSWGVLLEIAFASDERWETFRDLPAVRASLDAVPDPLNGLLIYPGRGGSAGKNLPRRPKPIAGAGAAELPADDTPPLHAVAEGLPPSGPAWAEALLDRLAGRARRTATVSPEFVRDMVEAAIEKRHGAA